MPIQTSMGAHKLEVLKGDRNTLVDYTGILDNDSAAIAAAVAGRVMSVMSGGKIEPGLAVGRLPLFAWSGTDVNNSPDVDRPATGPFRGMPNSGAARFGTISWRSAVELSTTEFIDDSGLIPDAALTCLSNAATDPLQRGLLKLANGTTDVVIGYVSPRGKGVGTDGYLTLNFLPAYVAGSTLPVA